MRAISIVFKKELGAYIRSPIGWIVAALFLLVDGVLFQGLALGENMLSADVLRKFMWVSSGVTIGAAIILSFHLIAAERQTHSMVLLNTSPVRDREIVLGKVLASVVVLGAILLASIYIPLLIKGNGKVTVSQILVGYLGLLMLGSAVMAIGMFASSLARTQLVAALLALVFTILLLVPFQVGKKVEPPLREVLTQIDLWWVHYQGAFMNGVFNLKDLVFYVAITYFFLLLSVKTLEAKRWQ
jgi:ABC-2 type transport system permease protein